MPTEKMTVEYIEYKRHEPQMDRKAPDKKKKKNDKNLKTTPTEKQALVKMRINETQQELKNDTKHKPTKKTIQQR